ncbi:MAG: GIY-YIG nuclease family protein [Burkholderiales bacterium]|nr:GIY-YIG nuclease family protein [Burkholderiales bacterium]
MNWCCYILRCADDTLYTGITNDIDQRLIAHNDGKASKYTRARRPVTLFYSENRCDRSDALKREAAIKRLPRAAKLQLCFELTARK